MPITAIGCTASIWHDYLAALPYPKRLDLVVGELGTKMRAKQFKKVSGCLNSEVQTLKYRESSSAIAFERMR